MREQVVPQVFLVASRGLDVHQRARQFEKIHPTRIFLDERNERKEPRRYKSRLLPLDSASSVSSRPQTDPRTSDDSGQALDLSPNRCGFSYRCDFGGQQHFVAVNLIGPSTSEPTGRIESPFRSGVRSCSELRTRLLMASAPLSRTIQV
jgi:hypothetical protein